MIMRQTRTSFGLAFVSLLLMGSLRSAQAHTDFPDLSIEEDGGEPKGDPRTGPSKSPLDPIIPVKWVSGKGGLGTTMPQWDPIPFNDDDNPNTSASNILRFDLPPTSYTYPAPSFFDSPGSFTPTSSVPTPGAGVLVVIGAAMSVARRRR